MVTLVTCNRPADLKVTVTLVTCNGPADLKVMVVTCNRPADLARRLFSHLYGGLLAVPGRMWGADQIGGVLQRPLTEAEREGCLLKRSVNPTQPA